MDVTPNLQLPYLAAAQAQKHVTHNEALRALDALVQIAVESRTLSTPPLTPVEGARYLIAANPAGDWANAAGQIAAFQDGAWNLFMPRAGWSTYLKNEGKMVVFDGTNWIQPQSASVNPVDLVGVNTLADPVNRLAVAAPASLFTHSGNGHQIKINKNAVADTAGFLMQTAYSGRAELGLTGDDNFHLKVSADGTNWLEALVVNRISGAVSTPNSPGPVRARNGAEQSLFNLADQWNAPSTIMTALGMSVTDTASHPTSRLLDLKLNAASVFSIWKDGQFVISNAGATSQGGMRRAGGAGEMALTSQIDPNTGSPADVLRFYWETGAIGSAAGSVAVLRGMGTNRLSIESGAAITHIAGNSRYEWEGLGSPRVQWIGYEAGSAIGRTIDINNSGQSPTRDVPLSVSTVDPFMDIVRFGSLVEISQTWTTLARFNGTGRLFSAGATLNTSLALTDANGANGFALFRGGTGVAQLWDQGGNIPGVALTFGSGTANPGLFKSGSGFRARLADDSNFARLQGQLQTHTNAVAGAVTPTHTIVLYDAAGTAYRVPCLI